MKYKYVITLTASPSELAELAEKMGESAPRMMRSIIKHVKEIRAEIQAEIQANQEQAQREAQEQGEHELTEGASLPDDVEN